MTLIEEKVKIGDQEFEQKTILCPVTDKPLLRVLIKEYNSDMVNHITVQSPFTNIFASHEISGLLSFSPITAEESRQHYTEIADVDSVERDGTMHTIITLKTKN
jgi:hypothetical protein